MQSYDKSRDNVPPTLVAYAGLQKRGRICEIIRYLLFPLKVYLINTDHTMFSVKYFLIKTGRMNNTQNT